MELDNEPALIDASRRGDTGAFAILVERYQRMIHALTYRMSGSEADAADLAQDAFVLAWRRLDTFRHDSKFSSWLYRITLNHCLNWQGRTARETKARAEWSDAEAISTSPGSVDPRVALVPGALRKLPPKQRAAIVLTVFDGMTHDAAAQVLGCSETTVSWRIFAAKRKLKRWLQQSGSRSGGPQ